MRLWYLAAGCCAVAAAQQGLTPAVQALLHVEGNRLVDASGQTILLRGTQMSALDGTLDALTPTTFSQIRQRWNMNALRLMVSVPVSRQDATYLPRSPKSCGKPTARNSW